MPRCGIVILAAGASTRMGSPKQSLQFEGESLLRRAVAMAMSCKCRPIMVVLGCGADELKGQLNGLPISIVTNERWPAGMGTSIRAGITAIGKVDAAMIFLCDQPLVSAAALDELVEAHFQSGKQITAAFYAGTAGTPAVFASSLFDELLSLEDHQGGKAIIQRYPEQVFTFPLPEAQTDIDTAADFARLVRGNPKNEIRSNE